MADWYRQGEQPQDRSEHQQAEHERGQEGSEWRDDSERWRGEYGLEGSRSEGSQIAHGSQDHGQVSRSYGLRGDAPQQHGQSSGADGTQDYRQGTQGYGGQQRSYGGYGSESREAGWQHSGSYGGQHMGRAGSGSQTGYGAARPGHQAFGPEADSQREFGGPQRGVYGEPQPGHGRYGAQPGYGSGQPSGYSGHQSQVGHDPGAGWQGGYGRAAYGPSGERTGYAEGRWQGGYDAGWPSGYGQQGRMQRRGPKGYKRSDERIREDLCERLMLADVDASEVTVDVRDGRVILQGSVPQRRMKHRIEDIADECFGVEDVENNLRVVRQDWEGTAPGRAGTEYDFDALNRCLRSELSAIETYRQALDRDRTQYGAYDEFQRLSQIQREHEDAAARLRQLIRGIGGEPSGDSGAWGTWSKVVMGAAKLFGDKSALKALKEGEESGLAEYRRYLREFAGSVEAVRLTSELMARQQRHIGELDQLLAAAD